MDTQTRRLTELIENIVYHFGTQRTDGECCENISHAEFRALHAALYQDVCTMQDIAKSAVVTKSGATRIVRRLEDKKLAHREQDPKDGRICCVTLTGQGRSLLNSIEEQLMNKVRTMLEVMDPAMREILIISLGAFFQAAQQRMINRDML